MLKTKLPFPLLIFCLMHINGVGLMRVWSPDQNSQASLVYMEFFPIIYTLGIQNCFCLSIFQLFSTALGKC